MSVTIAAGVVYVSGITAQLTQALAHFNPLAPMSSAQAAIVADADIVIMPTMALINREQQPQTLVVAGEVSLFPK